MKNILISIIVLIPYFCFAQDTNKAKSGSFTIIKRHLVIIGNTNNTIRASVPQLAGDPVIGLPWTYADSKIISFEITLAVNGIVYTMCTSGGKLSSEMLARINQLKSGSYLVVQNVRIKHDDGREEVVAGTVIKIV